MNKWKHCFELFGFDLIVDNSFNIYILEVNTNPGLEESSPLIKALVPRLIDDAFRLTIDDVFETVYKDESKSVFPVEGYDDKEIMWDLVVELDSDDEVCNSKKNEENSNVKGEKQEDIIN